MKTPLDIGPTGTQMIEAAKIVLRAAGLDPRDPNGWLTLATKRGIEVYDNACRNTENDSDRNKVVQEAWKTLRPATKTSRN